MVEALAAGCAIVTTDWRAIPEVALGPDHATIVPPADSNALARGFETLAADQQARLAQGIHNL